MSLKTNFLLILLIWHSNVPTYVLDFLSHISLILWEICCLVHHIVGSFSNNQRLSFADDSGKNSLHLSRGTLATHKEEPEDCSLQHSYDNVFDNTSGIWRRQDAASMPSQHKNSVALVLVIIVISISEFVKSVHFSACKI